MDRESIISLATTFVEDAPANRVAAELAISEELVGMRMFQAPIFGFGAAADPYFQKLQEPTAVGPHFRLPSEWLPGAKTAISFFLPFTETVTVGNSRAMDWPSPEWLHARIEGQSFLISLCKFLQAELQSAGYRAVVPALDPRFTMVTDVARDLFTSNWSERHVAFVCGLGTFGLSRGLITKRGVAGRFGSLVTDLQLPPDERLYEDVYEYCTFCGACVQNCPAEAISLSAGKRHIPCSDFLLRTKAAFSPRYGCGKCQVQVPCATGIPGRAGTE